MKITKLLSTVAAAAVVTSALAVSASANLIPQDGTNSYIAAGAGNYGIFVTATGEGDAHASTLAADYNIELTDIHGVRFTVTIPETDSMGNDGNRVYWDGSLGGGVVTSLHSDTDKSTYNWPSQGNFWGVIDEELGLETLDAAQDLQFEKVGDYTYEMTCMFDFDEAINSIEGDHIVQYRIFLQCWDNGMADYVVSESALLDEAGNELVVLDGKGYPVTATTTPVVDTDAPVVDTDAPVETGKDAVDTGVEGVAAVAGVAVVAAGAVVLSKKRK